MTATEPTGEFDADAYLRRIGVDPEGVVEPDWEALSRLQAAHVQAVPFENLSIVGHPHRDDADTVQDDGVVLDTTHLFEKVVERERGGYCFELNGLFHSLLADLGYDVDRVAARVLGSGGDDTPPANHHSNVVHLHRSFVVDVGTGTPQIRQPVPLDGTEVTDDAGVTWRVAESDREDATHETQYREPHERDWTTRYVFDVEPRDLSYFAATNDYLQSSPDSTFARSAFVTIASPDGYRKLSANEHRLVTFHESDGSDAPHARRGSRDRDVVVEKRTRERPVDPDDWDAVLAATYGIEL
ncbi:arylamine N-acetyltransferase [Halorubellus sp. JP-L1]|uniref:arylamine N-acetyltransferase family protein n=1 Tax=Halorubellus sp. JP-L1 TaxID=2715753 RepID=UPI00140D5546|nr:arylamine N-acetyltransferase [Halorubellus sp. JP-L1]NHN43240.1 arylamine N-acetyltransferase [Halorubellus sp. JP-L1]